VRGTNTLHVVALEDGGNFNDLINKLVEIFNVVGGLE